MRYLAIALSACFLLGDSHADEEAAAKARLRAEQQDYRRHARRVVERDRFPVLFDPKLTPVAQAKGIRDNEPVIGIVVGDDAQAFPISIMGRHELANVTCGKNPLTVSW